MPSRKTKTFKKVGHQQSIANARGPAPKSIIERKLERERKQRDGNLPGAAKHLDNLGEVERTRSWWKFW